MDTRRFIQKKFQAWAQRHNIHLQGSEGDRGEPYYTYSVEANLFGNWLHPDVRICYENGAGGELRGEIPSFQALHSSAAMAVNLFQHWFLNREYSLLAHCLNVPSRGIDNIVFEHCYPVCENYRRYGLTNPPHLDLGIDYENNSQHVGVECKLIEPFTTYEHDLLSNAYLEIDELWSDIPAWRQLGEELNNNNNNNIGFNRFDAAQIIRHVLGLKFGIRADRVRLIYLYYDSLGKHTEEHREEIVRFRRLFMMIQYDLFR